MLSLLILLLSCKGCAWCAIDITGSNDNNNEVDEGTSEASATSSEVGFVDTGPPPPCDSPEVEPNNTFGQAQEIPMEAWACGVLSEDGGIDTLKFSTPGEEAGWLEVWGRAEAFGSDADLYLTLSDASETWKADLISSPGSTDPKMVVPIPGGLTWYTTLSDAGYSFGDQHDWELLASMSSKAPLDWDREEGDDNSSIDNAELVTSGERIFGLMETGTDRDWYRVAVPEGRSTLTATIEAWNYGSPANTPLSYRDPCGDKPTDATVTSGATGADWDPVLVRNLSDAGEWYVLVKPDDNSAGVGGELYWYVLTVEVTTDPPDTTGSADPLECDTGQPGDTGK